MFSESNRILDTQLETDQSPRAGQAPPTDLGFGIAILDSMTAKIAVLNEQGLIVAVNEPWRRSALARSLEAGIMPRGCEVGTNYLTVCDIDDDYARCAGQGIRDVIAGRLHHFVLEYPCNSATDQCWFIMSVTPLADSTGRVVVSHADITTNKNVEEALRLSQHRLRVLLDYQHRSKEDERISVAREIHDELGTALMAVKAKLLVCMDQEQCPPNPLLAEACGLIDSAVGTVRKMIIDLRPSVLDNLGLLAAIEWFAGHETERAGLYCRVLIDPALEEYTIAEHLSTALFRITQEVLSNVIREANATEVEIRLRYETASIRLDVEDNGYRVGIDDAERDQSWSTIGIVERARFLGGNATLVNTTTGTLVSVTLPLESC
ncbi:signal transduction histidine kinase [Oxalobacteraceae bacterium GrIS 2.11]